MTPTGNPIQEQSDRTHADAMETAAMAGWLLLYGAWQGASGGTTRPEAELMLECYARTLSDLDQLRHGLIDDADSNSIHADYESCREALIIAIREPARVVRPIGLKRARDLLRDFETAARAAERSKHDYDPGSDSDQFQCDDRREEITDLLANRIDYRSRYLKAEDDAEMWGHVANSLERAVQKIGPGIKSAYDVRCRFETLQGEVLAAEQRRDELAAFVVQLMEHLKSFRTNDMNSGLEAQHHAIIASPRSLETEAVSYALLRERVDKIYNKILSDRERETEHTMSQLEGEINRNAELERRVDSTIDLYKETISENDRKYRELETRHKRMLNVSTIVVALICAALLAQTLMAIFH